MILFLINEKFICSLTYLDFAFLYKIMWFSPVTSFISVNFVGYSTYPSDAGLLFKNLLQIPLLKY